MLNKYTSTVDIFFLLCKIYLLRAQARSLAILTRASFEAPYIVKRNSITFTIVFILDTTKIFDNGLKYKVEEVSLPLPSK